MSHISEVVIIGAWSEDVDTLNTWLAENDTRKPCLRFVEKMGDRVLGGNKVFTSRVAAGAFNYLPHEFIIVLRDPATWQYSCTWSVTVEGHRRYAGIVTLGARGCEVESVEGYDD